MNSAQGIFQHHFQCKKVRTILNKIQEIIIGQTVDMSTSLLISSRQNVSWPNGRRRKDVAPDGKR